MADSPASPAAPSAPSTTPTAAAAPTIDLKLPGAAPTTPAANPAAPAPEGAPKAEQVSDDADRISLGKLARASREAREARQETARLKAELDAAKPGADKAAKLDALLEQLKKNPRKALREHVPELTFQQILDAYTEPEAEDDPKVTALADEVAQLKKQREDEAAEKKRLEEETLTEQQKQQIAHGVKLSGELLAEEGAKPGADGKPRWALASKDSTAAEYAYNEVRSAVIANKWQVTNEQARELMCQAFDQIEAFKRTEVVAAAETLGLAPRAESGNGNRPRRHELQSTPRQELTPPEPKPSIDSASRGPLPAATKVARMQGGPRQLGVPR